MLGVGYSVSILIEVLLFPPSRQGAYQRFGYKPVPRSVLRVLKVVNAARALKRSETNMAQMSLPRSAFDTRVARLYALKFPSHPAASRAWWCGKAGPDKPSRKGRTRRRTQQHKEPWQAGDQLGPGCAHRPIATTDSD